jgi:hypothetical protein
LCTKLVLPIGKKHIFLSHSLCNRQFQIKKCQIFRIVNSGLKNPGTYTFEVTVSDTGPPVLSDTTTFTINATVAVLPVIEFAQPEMNIWSTSAQLIEIDASRSHSFDFTPLKFNWTASSTSPASFTYYGNSTTNPILRLLNVGIGKYNFTLKAKDSQNQVKSETISLWVHEDTDLVNMVEINIPNCPMITEAEKEDAHNELLLNLKQTATDIHITKIVKEQMKLFF